MADLPVDPVAPGTPEGSPAAGSAGLGLAAGPGGDAARGDPLSAMTPRFNLFFRFFARRFFRHFDLDDATVARLRALEAQGSVVYVMRYSSRLDYFLFNTLFRREGLRLSSFANGIRFYYYRPLLEALRIVWQRPRGVAQEVELVRARETTSQLTRSGGSFFLFLSTASLGTQLRTRERALANGKTERDLLGEMVEAAWDSPRPVHVVPLALFWRKGPRARRRFFNLSYGALTRPSDLAKVISFLTTYRGLHVKVGDPIDLREASAAHCEEGPSAVTRALRRNILTFLYREEKVVEGPILQPLHRVQEIVVRHSTVQQAILERAREKHVGPERARAQAEKMFREIAANMNSTFLAVLDLLVGAITQRLFASIEVSGLEKVAEYAKRNPLVLVPSHRSYFDFVIVSILFYRNHIIPPHIAARENMGFGPFGFLWRRAGAFFLRRSFDDPLYKAVFRTYVAYLIREGFTQEFFIEGGRSRTGKTLAPRLGMLAWDIDAFLDSGRRDLFFVPIAITYERLDEEGAMLGELEGQAKTDESLWGLLKARKFLRRRFGTVYVNFGEPISLAEALGNRRETLSRAETPQEIAERRAFIETTGTRIVERINWAVVPSATAIGACALLGERHRGMLRGDLARRMHEIVELLRLQDVRLTAALRRDAGAFRESIASLIRADLVRSTGDANGEILYFDPSRRRALDLYRNSILHYLAAPSFLACRLRAGASVADLHRDLALWLDLFYREFFVNRGELLAAHVGAFVDHFERRGWIERSDDVLRATEKGDAWLDFLAEQTRAVVEAYYAAFSAALAIEAPVPRKELLKTANGQFERASLLGEVSLPEAANAVTFGNAIDVLLARRILEPVPGAPGAGERRDPCYIRGAAFDELRVLQERLAATLCAR
ncbi:MAG: 1-acyl-sn-glycerol-3-phosphate acyltransferase [Myxococcales bacterium]|nr:1-acyl-sn-glycerol-3-phosphate acyltransferase [Myxococcales bacterium]